jgi:hypothetical protein
MASSNAEKSDAVALDRNLRATMRALRKTNEPLPSADMQTAFDILRKRAEMNLNKAEEKRAALGPAKHRGPNGGLRPQSVLKSPERYGR